MAKFDFGGTLVPMLDDGDFTFAEWETVKDLTGYRPIEFEQGIRALDPQAWRAYLVVCMRRVGADETIIDSLNLMEVAGKWSEWLTAAAEGKDSDPAVTSEKAKDFPPTSSDANGISTSPSSLVSVPGK